MSARVVRLDHVDFSIIRPILRIRHPESGPGAAAVRGVEDIEEEEACIVALLGFDADGFAALGGIVCGCVDAEDGRVGSGVGEVFGLGGLLTHVAG